MTYMQNESLEMIEYYRLLQEEMLHKKKILDTLIDSKQRYTKGILCEDLVRRLLRSILPSDITVAQGFIYYSGKKSQQCDVLIYNSARYAPFLSVNDLVVLPVEAVTAVIEVKTHLNQTELQKALHCFKSIDDICTAALGYYPIRKYILAFSSINLETLLRCKHLNPYPTQLDAICILGKGFAFKQSGASTNPEGYVSKDALFSLVVQLLGQFFFSTGIQGAAKNPYEAYSHQIRGQKIELDKQQNPA
jgi:hypothetical protein